LPVPFFRQLREQHRSDDELDAVARTLELARTAYGTRIDFDGGPAICHFIGSASASAVVGLPTPYVCFALIHNIYRSGEFRDGEPYGASADRRAHVRKWVGDEVEAMAYRRYESTDGGESLKVAPSEPDTPESRMEIVDICELYEKYENGRIHAANSDRDDRRRMEADPESVVARARLLIGDEFARHLELALARPADVPRAARSGLTYGVQLMPSSAVIRPSIVLRRARRDAFARGSRAARLARRKGRRLVERLQR
jgi:hypothetical protein